MTHPGESSGTTRVRNSRPNRIAEATAAPNSGQNNMPQMRRRGLGLQGGLHQRDQADRGRRRTSRP
jgi:hypothetical protein